MITNLHFACLCVKSSIDVIPCILNCPCKEDHLAMYNNIKCPWQSVDFVLMENRNSRGTKHCDYIILFETMHD